MVKARVTKQAAVAMQLPVEKSKQSIVLESLIDAMQITEWSQSGEQVIKYPIDLGVLLQSTLMGTFHKRCLTFKRIAAIGNGYDTEKPDAVRAVLSDFTLKSFVDDFLWAANGYLERESSALGPVKKLHHVRANTLWKTASMNWVQKVQNPKDNKWEWKKIPAEKIAHLREYSPLSDHYGVPEWLPALLPVALTWESNDFKRKFYQNGAHAGLLILLTGITGLTPEQLKEIENKIKGTKGPGHFNTLFMALKNHEAKIEIKGVAKESPVRDDYPEIQKSAREQVITAHGMPPRLMSVILDAKGGAMGGGELKDELRLFHLSYVAQQQRQLEEFLNPMLPAPIKFRDFIPDDHGNAEADPKPGTTPEVEEEEEEQPPVGEVTPGGGDDAAHS